MGTPGYTAPEVISGATGASYDGKTADVWSAAVMLYVMLYARYPFERPEDREFKGMDRTNRVLMRALKVDYAFPDAPHVSPECKDLIRRMLVADPAQRLPLAGVQAHPWFQDGLPAGSLEYNDWALQVPNEGLQSSEEVDAIIQQAHRAAAAARGGGGGGDDDLLRD